MVPVKNLLTHLEIHFVLLMSLSLIVTETLGYNYSMGLYNDPIIYPNNVLLRQTSVRSGGANTEEPEYDIPARLLEEMNEIEDPDELFARYFIGNQPPVRRIAYAGLGIGSRFGGLAGQTSHTPDNTYSLQNPSLVADTQMETGNYVPRPRMPICQPRDTSVELPPPMAGVLIEPPCVMVPRCGPCCRFGMKCLPVNTETVTYSVQLAKFIPDSQRFKVIGRRNITEVHHKSCKCVCDVKQEDCLSMDKKFDGTSCKCVCRDERNNRFYCSVRGRQWNSDSCTCDCHEIPCDEGYFYNKETCKCDF